MSIRAQIAFGKNFTLQKQLEAEFLNLRRIFKNSRRRSDTMEEECVAALYKLLLYAREKQGLTETVDMNIFNDRSRKSKSAGARRSQSALEMPPKADDKSQITRRPATAMSAKTYTQSYSFTKDGLNIGKTRHDRFMRTKAEKDRQKENNVKIQRMKDDWKNLEVTRPMTAIERTGLSADDEETEKEALPTRPKTACVQTNQTGLLSRPRTKNALMLPHEKLTMAQRSSTPVIVTASRAHSPLVETHVDGVDIEAEHIVGDAQTHSFAQDRNLQSPCLKTARENQTRLDGTKSPLVVRITTTRLKMSDNDETTTDFRAESRLDNTVEEELMSLNEYDKNHLNGLANTSHFEKVKRRSTHSRPATAGILAPSRNASTLNTTLDESILRKSAEKTQHFLTQYSKKSKVFSYVVKTRSSITAPRERLVSHRSPCITYQELASIKASIKQHESRTRSLLQRSAKLSTYVDKLANAGEMRKRLQEIKANSTSNNEQNSAV